MARWHDARDQAYFAALALAACEPFGGGAAPSEGAVWRSQVGSWGPFRAHRAPSIRRPDAGPCGPAPTARPDARKFPERIA
jgi:hypothetical protein